MGQVRSHLSAARSGYSGAQTDQVAVAPTIHDVERGYEIAIRADRCMASIVRGVTQVRLLLTE
jgi:hypothetical protein